MTSPAKPSQAVPELQLAAGGIIWRQIDGTFRLAVIHRPKYDDWTLPKGKQDPGETLAETARREVKEELGCEIVFGEFAGASHYKRADGKLKVVLFWHMSPVGEFHFVPNNEVDQVEWLTPEEAAAKLDHHAEVELIALAPPPFD